MNFEKIKNISYLGSSNFIASAIAAIFWFYIASEIEPEEFGMLHYFISIASLASNIALFGTQNTITVFTAKKKQLLSTLYFISLLIGLASTAVIIIFIDRLDTSLLLFGFIISALVNGKLIGDRNFSKYFLLIITQKLSILVFGLSFFYFLGSEMIIYGLALSFSVYLYNIYKEFKTAKINFSLLKKNISFIFSNYFTSLTSGISSSMDKLIIMPLLGAVVVGNFSLALQVFSIMLIFPTIIFKYLLPHDALKSDNKKVKQFSILITSLISFLGFFIAPILVSELFPKYTDASDAIQILSLSLVPNTITTLYASKFLAIEKSKYVLFSALFLNLILVVGIFVLGPLWGITGIAIAYTLSVVGKTVSLFLFGKKYLHEGIFH